MAAVHVNANGSDSKCRRVRLPATAAIIAAVAAAAVVADAGTMQNEFTARAAQAAGDRSQPVPAHVDCQVCVTVLPREVRQASVKEKLHVHYHQE